MAGTQGKEFAREHGIDPATTYQVLSGRKKGKRGEAHKVAVLLGMKDGIIVPRTMHPTESKDDVLA